jgi:hypothetical protein
MSADIYLRDSGERSSAPLEVTVDRGPADTELRRNLRDGGGSLLREPRGRDGATHAEGFVADVDPDARPPLGCVVCVGGPPPCDRVGQGVIGGRAQVKHLLLNRVLIHFVLLPVTTRVLMEGVDDTHGDHPGMEPDAVGDDGAVVYVGEQPHLSEGPVLPLEFDPQDGPPQAELGLGPHPGALLGPAAVAATFEPFDQVGVSREGDSIFAMVGTFQSSQVYLGLLGFTVVNPSDNC